MNKKGVLSIFSAIVFPFVFASCGNADDQMPDPNQGTGGGSGADSGKNADGTMSVTVCKVELRFDLMKDNVFISNKNDVMTDVRFSKSLEDRDELIVQSRVPANGTVNETVPMAKGMTLRLDTFRYTPADYPYNWKLCEWTKIVLP